MNPELSDEEVAALTKHLRQAIDDARFPLAPRLDPLKSILAKLEPPKPVPERLPPRGRGWGRAAGKGDGRV